MKMSSVNYKFGVTALHLTMKSLLSSFGSCLKAVIVTVASLSMILPAYSQMNMFQTESTKTTIKSGSDTLINAGYLLLYPRENTSAITTINYTDFNRGHINDPVQLIQGKVPGLDISKPGGDPSGSFYLRLRGLTTITCNTQPLIVIDGIPDASPDNLDPDDIESMTVLRDAAASAIYGIRGSNGVILITTKRGQKVTSSVTYNVYSSAEKVARNLPAMNATQWRALSNEMGMGTDFGNNTDWFRQIEQTALSQVHSLSFSGGNKNTSYRASVNYRDGEGVEIHTGYSRVNGRLNINQKALNERLTLNMNMSATQRKSKYGFPEAFRYASIFNPTAPVKSDDPEFEIYDGYFQQIIFDYYNPVSIIELNRNEGMTRLLDLSIGGVFELTKDIDIEAKYAVGSRGNLGGKYYDKNDYWGGLNRNGLASRQEDVSSMEFFEAGVHYEDNLSDALTMKAAGGYSFQEFINEGFYAQGGDFITDDFTFNNLSAALDFKNGLGTVTSYKNSNKLIAFFGQFNLNFKDILFGNITARYEGSSRLGYDSRWNLFHGIGVGADLSKIFRIRPFDMLKLRIDQGQTGNQPDESYLSLEIWEPLWNTYYNGNFIPYYGIISNSNPYIKSEKTNSTDIGIDFSLLSNKFKGSIDYYSSKSNNVLFDGYIFPVPPNLTYHKLINIGKLGSKGLELSIEYNIIKNHDLSYTIRLTHSHKFQDNLISLSGTYNGTKLKYGINNIGDLGSPGQCCSTLIRSEEGKPIGQLQGYVFEGIDENGNRILADLDFNGYIDFHDMTVVGNGLPKNLTGFENVLSYKNWDLNVFFRCVTGHDLLNSYRTLYELPVFINSYNLPVTAADMRNPENGRLLNQYGVVTNIDFENASFFSLDNISLGYKFSLPENSAFRNIRLYGAANNLFYLTHYKGSDPNPRYVDTELYSGSYNSPLVPGIDRRNTWPRTRSFTMGAEFEF